MHTETTQMCFQRRQAPQDLLCFSFQFDIGEPTREVSKVRKGVTVLAYEMIFKVVPLSKLQ